MFPQLLVSLSLSVPTHPSAALPVQGTPREQMREQEDQERLETERRKLRQVIERDRTRSGERDTRSQERRRQSDRDRRERNQDLKERRRRGATP